LTLHRDEAQTWGRLILRSRRRVNIYRNVHLTRLCNASTIIRGTENRGRKKKSNLGICDNSCSDRREFNLLQCKCFLSVYCCLHLVWRCLWHDAPVWAILFCLCIARPLCSRRSANGCRSSGRSHVFSIIQATLASTNMSTFHPAPFGIHMLIAGLIFASAWFFPEDAPRVRSIRSVRAI